MPANLNVNANSGRDLPECWRYSHVDGRLTPLPAARRRPRRRRGRSPVPDAAVAVACGHGADAGIRGRRMRQGWFRVGLPPGRSGSKRLPPDGRKGSVEVDGGPGAEVVIRIGAYRDRTGLGQPERTAASGASGGAAGGVFQSERSTRATPAVQAGSELCRDDGGAPRPTAPPSSVLKEARDGGWLSPNLVAAVVKASSEQCQGEAPGFARTRWRRRPRRPARRSGIIREEGGFEDALLWLGPHGPCDVPGSAASNTRFFRASARAGWSVRIW